MTLISKTPYIDKIDYIVDKCVNTYWSIIKMKLVDVKSNTYINSIKEIDDKGPKFKIGYIVRIWKYKNNLAKNCIPNWSEEALVVKEVKNIVLLTCY